MLTRCLLHGLVSTGIVDFVFQVRDFPDVDDELVAVCGPDHNRHAQRGSRLVEGGAEDLEDRGVDAKPKNDCSFLLGTRAVIQSV